MIIDTNQILTMTEVNQNFSKAAKLIDKRGSAIIFKNNRPKYILADISNMFAFDLTDSEKIDIIAKRIIEKHRKAFEELGK
jgi:antitoxin Phd